MKTEVIYLVLTTDWRSTFHIWHKEYELIAELLVYWFVCIFDLVRRLISLIGKMISSIVDFWLKIQDNPKLSQGFKSKNKVIYCFSHLLLVIIFYNIWCCKILLAVRVLKDFKLTLLHPLVRKFPFNVCHTANELLVSC